MDIGCEGGEAGGFGYGGVKKRHLVSKERTIFPVPGSRGRAFERGGRILPQGVQGEVGGPQKVLPSRTGAGIESAFSCRKYPIKYHEAGIDSIHLLDQWP